MMNQMAEMKENKKLKKLEEAELQVVVFTEDDVIVTSGCIEDSCSCDK